MRFLMSGESHGKQLTAIIEGVPAGLAVSVDLINDELRKRQSGYGRGSRMKIESDTAQIVSGVRHGLTLGSPITLVIENKDFENHRELMSTEPVAGYEVPAKTVPRPGHTDLVGAMKYNHRDLQNVLERASARDTAIRVAVGALAKQILAELGIEVLAHVAKIGGVVALDDQCSHEIRAAIDSAKATGDTLGGEVQIIAQGVPAGLGSYVHYDRKLDAKMAAAIMSVQSVKGVSFGNALQASASLGSTVHDGITHDEEGFNRTSNHYGGFEGGMTNGMPLVIHALAKPIPTLQVPMKSVCLSTHKAKDGMVERSDTCVVHALSVILEAVVATELAKEILTQFNADTLPLLKKDFEAFREYVRKF